MVQSKASTFEEYLAELPEERCEVVVAVRTVILDNLPEGYQESMSRGMPSYEIPLSRYPTTYNKKPLAYAAAGKKLDMGKSCVRFKNLDDLPLDVIGRSIAATSVDAYIARYEASRQKK